VRHTCDSLILSCKLFRLRNPGEQVRVQAAQVLASSLDLDCTSETAQATGIGSSVAAS